MNLYCTVGSVSRQASVNNPILIHRFSLLFFAGSLLCLLQAPPWRRRRDSWILMVQICMIRCSVIIIIKTYSTVHLLKDPGPLIRSLSFDQKKNKDDKITRIPLWVCSRGQRKTQTHKLYCFGGASCRLWAELVCQHKCDCVLCSA